MIERFRRWVQPPELVDAEQNRRAGLLYPILVVVIPLTIGFVIILWVLAPANIFARNVAIFAVLVELAALFVLRSGHVNTAGVGMLLALWAGITASMYVGDGVRSVSSLGQMLIILMAGLLVSARFAVGLTVLTLVANYAMMVLQLIGFKTPNANVLDISAAWAVQSLFFLISVGLTQAYVRSLHRSFNEALHKEQALKERVSELRQAQAQLEMSDQNLHRREAILEAVGVAAERLFRGHSFAESVQLVMRDLGLATGVDRVHIFENRMDADTNQLTAHEVYVWLGEGVSNEMSHLTFKTMFFRESGLQRWADLMSSNKVVKAQVAQLPEGERKRLQAQGLQSVLVVPIFVGDQWWGFIGFDEAKWEREWSPAEEDAVRGAAGILGGAIQRMRVEKALNQSEERYFAILQDQSELICRYTPDGRMTFANEAFARFYGTSAEKLANSQVWNLMDTRDAEMLRAKIEALTPTRPASPSRTRNKRHDGKQVWLEWTDRGIFDASGLLIEIQAVGRDVDEEVRLREQLEENLREREAQALTDPLTGLLNRRAITQHAQAEWQRAVREERPLSVVLMDVDRLKQINDTYGHLAGDSALHRLGDLVQKSMRRYDWAGRWGGDEFLLVLPGADLEAARDVAERLRMRFSKDPITLESGAVHLRVSLGVASLSKIDSDKDSVDKLFARADEALYNAKQSGRDQVGIA